jgi:hypothetical protein
VPEPCRFLLFFKPDGYLFTPPTLRCDGGDHTLTPGSRLTVLSDWKQDECVDFNQNGCTTASLPPGDYTVEGGVWSQDRQSYAEFSATYNIGPQTQTPTPSPTPVLPVELPNGGGAPVEPPGAGKLGAGIEVVQPGAQSHDGRPASASDSGQPAAHGDGGGPSALAIGTALVLLGTLALAGVGFAARRRHSPSSTNRP